MSPSLHVDQINERLLMPLTLAVVLLTGNVARGTILRMVDSSPLSLGDRPI